MSIDKNWPRRIPVERTKPLLRPESVRRTKSFEESSAAAQRAIHESGGLIPVIDRIAEGFPSRTDAGRLVGLQMTVANARTELEGIDVLERRSPRASRLRETINDAVRQMNALTAQVQAERQYAARACLMSAAAGEPAALTELARHASRVSPDFLASIVAANT